MPDMTTQSEQTISESRNRIDHKLEMRFVLFSFLLLVASASSIAAQSSVQTSQPAGSSGISTVLAEVNGKPVTSEDVETALGMQLSQLEEQVYQLKRQRLESLIAEQLLAQEAARRGIQVQTLLDAEVTAKAVPVTDQNAEDFYQANKAQIGGTLDANLRNRIISYLQNQRLNARREEFLQSLRAQSKIVVNLMPPSSRIKLAVDGAPFRGGAQAPVTIIEFSDFHCPFCNKVQPTITQVMARYGDKVKLVYRHLPIDQLHPQARKAAEASMCANDQGKFWDYHDKLYTNGPDASPEKLKVIAQSVGLDGAAFESCLITGKYQAAVQKEVEEGARLGISGTPTFFINGRILTGASPLESFIRLIDEELSRIQASDGATGRKDQSAKGSASEKR